MYRNCIRQFELDAIVGAVADFDVAIGVTEVYGFTQLHGITCTTLGADVETFVRQLLVQIGDLAFGCCSVCLDAAWVVLGIAQTSDFTRVAINRYRVRVATDIDDACTNIGDKTVVCIAYIQAVCIQRGQSLTRCIL